MIFRPAYSCRLRSSDLNFLNSVFAPQSAEKDDVIKAQMEQITGCSGKAVFVNFQEVAYVF